MQLFVCGLVFYACAIGLVFVASFFALVAGVVGLVAHGGRRRPRPVRSLSPYIGLATAGAVVLAFVGYPVWRFLRSLPAFNTTTMESATMQPFIAAMDEIDRASLGFTPIPSDATIRIERALRNKRGYDVMLHIYADTSRTVAFTEEHGAYRWIGEQEIHEGPRRYESVDGAWNEFVVIEYYTVPILGAPSPVNRLHVFYEGDDPRLWGKANLTLEYVQPILEEWRSLHTATPTPVQ